MQVPAVSDQLLRHRYFAPGTETIGGVAGGADSQGFFSCLDWHQGRTALSADHECSLMLFYADVKGLSMQRSLDE
jgi:hypothetical protein